MTIGAGQNSPFVTPDGGLAIRLINKTGAASVKGTLIDADHGVDNAFKLVSIDEPDCFGIVYEDGIADGELTTVVFSGIAKVFFVGSTTHGQFGRVTTAADTGAENGKAIAEAVPTAPFSTDKHFMEIGHVLESRTGAGLANVVLHFN